MPQKVEIHVAFVSWNDATHEYAPLPRGLEVRVMDYDPISPNDRLSQAQLDEHGRVDLEIELEDGASPDVFFELDTAGWALDPVSGALAAAGTAGHLPLPDRWSSRDRFALDRTRGYFDDFSGPTIGDAEHPLTFPFALSGFFRLVYWNPVRERFVGMPQGLTVQAVDRDAVSADDVLARGHTDAEGRVYVRVLDPNEARPDVFVQFELPERSASKIDPWTNRILAKGEDVPDAVDIPRGWSSREAFALEHPDRAGLWKEHAAPRIGRFDAPYVFDVLEGAPIFTPGNVVRHLIDGERVLPRIEAALRAATKTIHLEVMYWFDDPIGRRVQKLLLERAADGIEVRLMFGFDTTALSDDFLALKRVWIEHFIKMPAAARARMSRELDEVVAEEKHRGDTAALRAELAAHPNIRLLNSDFPAIELFPQPREGLPEAYRAIEADVVFFSVARVDHRKTLIIDGKLAFTGGMNIGQEYLYDEPFDPALPASEEPWAKWHDVMCEIEGPAVRQMQHIFRERWVTEGGDAFDLGPSRLGVGADPDHPTFPTLEPAPDGLPVQVFTTTPGRRLHTHQVYSALIEEAREEICIANPYFSDREFLQRILRAAERGVRVRIFFPDEHNDSTDFLYSGRIMYEALLDAGVEVFEYQNHTLHAKVMVVDHRTTVIGSANLNHASMYKHYELSVAVEDEAFARDFEAAMFEVDVPRSRRIQRQDLEALTAIHPLAQLYLRAVVQAFF